MFCPPALNWFGRKIRQGPEHRVERKLHILQRTRNAQVQAALANTLTSLFDIDYINVYVDGMDPGYLGMLWALSSRRRWTSLLCDQIIQEQKRITDDDAYGERRIITFMCRTKVAF